MCEAGKLGELLGLITSYLKLGFSLASVRICACKCFNISLMC